MKFLDAVLPDNLHNIAVDEALLDAAENGEQKEELLRLWEPDKPVVVLGRSSPFATEVNHEYCRSNQIEIVRRASGGQSVVNGPGCLIYSVLLDYRKRPELRMLDSAHSFVMKQIQSAVESLGIRTRLDGTSDLTIDSGAGQRRKFSGNALRCRRNWMLYHGTLLCDADLDLIARCLGPPKRMPDYRNGRSHADFLTQLPVSTAHLATAVRDAWNADPSVTRWPQRQTEALIETKYSQRAWNEKV